jgi:arginase
MRTGKVAVFGVPTAAASVAPGVARAAFALREQGLLKALRARGATVVNLSDLSLFPLREDPEHPRARNTEVIACALRAGADEMTRAVPEGFTVLLGGDCTMGAAAAGGAAKALGRPVGLVWLDANADLNTEATSPSGIVGGMALSIALGRGPAGLPEAAGSRVDPARTALVGYREVDEGEREPLAALALSIPADEARAADPAALADRLLAAVGGGPTVVHMDVDVIDPSEMPAKAGLTPGQGLTRAQAAALLSALVRRPEVVALVVASYDPDRDPDGSCGAALVDIIAGAVGARLGS